MILNSDQEWFTREQDSMQERIDAKHVMQEHVGRSRQRAQEKHEHVKGDEGLGWCSNVRMFLCVRVHSAGALRPKPSPPCLRLHLVVEQRRQRGAARDGTAGCYFGQAWL